MRWQRLAMILSLSNLVLLAVSMSQVRPVGADTAVPVLRGRALELVDDRGRVRAEIKVLPGDPNVTLPDGSRGFPETVQLRLIDSHGGPNVKVATTEDGAALVVGGDAAYVQILSRAAAPFIKIVSRNGRQRTIDANDVESSRR